jgi:hypothetical protein
MGMNMKTEHKHLLVDLDRDYMGHRIAGSETLKEYEITAHQLLIELDDQGKQYNLWGQAVRALESDIGTWSQLTGISVTTTVERVLDYEFDNVSGSITRFKNRLWMQFESDLDLGFFKMSMPDISPSTAIGLTAIKGPDQKYTDTHVFLWNHSNRRNSNDI